MTAPAMSARKSAWIPWVFVAGMGVVFIANGFLAWLALSTWPGLETEGHYQKGIAYNQTLAAADRQARMGWSVGLSLQPVTQGTPSQFTIEAHYKDKAGAALGALTVRAHLIRPVHEGHDQKAALQETAPGVYRGHVTVPLVGQWDVRLVAIDKDGNTHQWLERVQVR